MNERQGRRLQKTFLKKDEQDRKAGLANLLSTYEGRRWLWFLLSETAVFHNPHTPNSDLTLVNIGMQNVGRLLLDQLSASAPDALTTMMKENQDVERERNERRAALDRDERDA